MLLLHPRAKRYPQLPTLLQRLRATYELEVCESLHAGHTLEICRERLGQFSGVVLTAGGDGTFHEAVNAWAELGFPEGPRFAPLPLGTGNDFLYSIDRRFRQVQIYLEHTLSHRAAADLGRVTYQTDRGTESRYFCVGATAGFSATVTFRRARLADKIPGSISYLIALFSSLGGWRNTWCRVEAPEAAFEDPTFFALNCANVKFYGGGMISAPRADAFAGCLQGVAMNLTLPEVFRALPQNFRGDFDVVRNVRQFPVGETLTLTTGRPCLVQADGEPLGQTPMVVECLPGKLPILLPSLG